MIITVWPGLARHLPGGAEAAG